MGRKAADLERQLTEQQELLAEETKQKLSNQSTIRKLEHELGVLMEEQQEQAADRQKLVNENTQLKQQLNEARKKANEDIVLQFEDLKKRNQKEVEALHQQIESAEMAQKRAEAAKKKCQQEVGFIFFCIMNL